MYSDDVIANLPDRINEGFDEFESAIIVALPRTDARYADLKEQEQELKRRFPLIEHWFEDDGPLSLSSEEHAAMLTYLDLNSDMEGIERLAIYYAGHRDCIAYLQKTGIL